MTKISQTYADIFHNFVAQLLYLSKQARRYIQLEVSFLFTSVRYPDTEKYNKLSRIMKYIQVTIGLPLIVAIHKYVNISWYVGAACMVNKAMRRHNGGLMNMVTGQGLCSIQQTNKLTLRVQTRPCLSWWTMYWHRWSWSDTSWNNRNTRSTTMLPIHITRAP